MKVALLVVGQTVDGPFAAAIEDYVGRLRHYLSFQIDVVQSPKNVRSLPREQVKTKEGEQIIRAIQSGDYVVLLDEGGREFRSVEFADYLQKKMNNAVGRRLLFVVGGAYGFSPEVYALADEKMSLSRMTFSHQMVRLVFVEQLYRALTILNNEPYHHE